MRYVGENKKFNRRSFFKLGFASILGAALFLLSGCIPGEEEDDD